MTELKQLYSLISRHKWDSFCFWIKLEYAILNTNKNGDLCPFPFFVEAEKRRIWRSLTTDNFWDFEQKDPNHAAQTKPKPAQIRAFAAH